MPTRFVEVWLEGNSYLPLPRAYLNEPFRLYRNRLRGFFLKNAPDYPALDNDLVVRAYNESQYLGKLSMSRQFRGFASRGGSLRSTQMSLADRQRLIQRRQRQAGYRVSSFAPQSRVSVLYPETKYFDTQFDTSVTWAGTDWSNSEVPCDNYVNSSATAAAYTDSCLIPTAIGSGYGQINGNRYKLKKLRCRGIIQTPPLQDQADAAYPVFGRLMMVMDTQPNGAQAQGEDIMQDMGAARGNLFTFKRTSASSGRFRILKDKFFVLHPTNSQTDGANTGSIGYS
jgi:hypothetical protein